MMNKRYYLTIFFSMVFTVCLCAQHAPDWQWAKNGTNMVNVGKNGIAFDMNGNIYVAGSYTSNMTIGTQSVNSVGAKDIFIVKFNSAGNIVWLKSAGGPGDDEGVAIGVTPDAHVYVTGNFNATASFSSGSSVTSIGQEDIYLARYTSDGDLIWAKSGGSIAPDAANAVCVGKSGNVYITGSFANSASSDTAYFDMMQLVSKGGSDVFVAKYDQGGNVIWVDNGGTSSSDIGASIVCDDVENIYVSGGFSGTTAWFDGYSATSNSSGLVLGNMFLVKYNSDGDALWATHAGGKNQGPDLGSIGGSSIAADPNGNVYIAGVYFNCDIKFADNTVLSDMGNGDMYLAKYNSGGGLEWANKAGGIGLDAVNGIAVDGESNVYITGYFSAAGNFGSKALQSQGNEDVFVAKYNKSGQELWAAKAGGSGSESSNAIAVTPNGETVISGSFNSTTASFGPLTLNKTSNTDLFVAKLATFPASVNNVDVEKISLFPNPVTETVNIKGIGKGSYLITDICGRSMLTGMLGKDISVKELPAGLYFITIHDDGLVHTSKFEKR